MCGVSGGVCVRACVRTLAYDSRCPSAQRTAPLYIVTLSHADAGSVLSFISKVRRRARLGVLLCARRTFVVVVVVSECRAIGGLTTSAACSSLGLHLRRPQGSTPALSASCLVGVGRCSGYVPVAFGLIVVGPA
jgi:hypothetical protein